MSNWTAKVKFEITVVAGGSWSDDCTMGQVKKQAVKSAKHRLESALALGDDGSLSEEWRRRTAASITPGRLLGFEVKEQ